MSRHRSASSYGHAISYCGFGGYRVSWVVDHYYPGSRLRYPRSRTRDTDEAGAQRFAKRWKVEMPALSQLEPSQTET